MARGNVPVSDGGGPTQNYWQCLPLGKNNHNRHIKSIVNTQLVDPANLVECARLLLPCSCQIRAARCSSCSTAVLHK